MTHLALSSSTLNQSYQFDKLLYSLFIYKDLLSSFDPINLCQTLAFALFYW